MFVTNGYLQLSASSAALDLASSQSPGSEPQTSSLARHRLSEQLVPSTSFSAASNGHPNSISSMSLQQQKSSDNFATDRHLNRHSMEASLAAYSKANLSNQPLTDTSRPSLTTIHPSYSTNDVPTLKNASSSTDVTPPKTHAQQHFHNHNASLGRIPPNMMGNRHSRELSGGDNRRDEQASTYQQLSSALQASAAPFGPPLAVASPNESSSSQMPSFNNGMVFQSQPFFGGYGVQTANNGMNSMQPIGNPLAFHNQMQVFQPQQNGYPQFPNYGSQGRYPDNQARVMQQRRVQNGDGMYGYCLILPNANAEAEQARYNNVQLQSLQGEILALCKDQHGCRYLQKKLEERDPESIQLIFMETHRHVVELMTGLSPDDCALDLALANAARSIRQLPLSKTARIFQQRSAHPIDTQCSSRYGQDCIKQPRYTCAPKDD